MSVEQGPHHRSIQKSERCLSPPPLPHLQQPPGRSGTRMKSCLDPAATPGEPHSSASPRLTSPLPQQLTTHFFPDEGTTDPQTSELEEVSEIRKTPLNWSGLITPHPAPSVINTPEHTKAPLETCPSTDATLQNTTPTRTNYAAKMNLASPNPANEEGPAAFTTSASIMAKSWKTSVLPRQPHCQEDQSPKPTGHHERFEGPPSDTNMAHGPATDKRKPLHPWSEFLRIELNSTARNATKLHRRTPTTPTKPWEPSLQCPAPSRQTPGLASTDGASGRNPRLWIC
ncbi:hypothetical protein E4T56_gene227 [Termitomyces sp. T112]|nr:hypothetical protein E4T56_gene227 [Termitomyces sp. T112]